MTHKMTLSTGNQLRAARALLGMDQAELAKRAGVDINTVRNLEGRGPDPLGGRVDTLRKVQGALERAGIEFLNHGQPGVRLVGAKAP
jgi:transcriptional regulator with XRE-family HTH domain